MSVTPSTLPALTASLPWPTQGFEYRWRSSSTGYEHYDVWETNANPPGWWAAAGLQGIKVDTATDTWYDDGVNDPQSLSLSGGVLSVLGGSGGNSPIYDFTKPTTASWLGGSGPTVQITNSGRNIEAQVSNVTASATYNLTDASSNPVGSPLYLNGNTTTSGTISYQAPVNITSGAHVYAVRTGNPSVPSSLVLVTSQSLQGLNPSWSESWNLTNNTLSATIDTPSGWISPTETGLHPYDVISIKDINTGTQITGGSYTLQTGYNVQNLPITINGTISLTQSGTYGLYITDNNITAQIGSTYQYTAPAPAQYSISNPVWAPQNGNVISVNWTEANNDGSHSVELWKSNGSSAITSSTTGGPLTYTLQSNSDTGTYELKYTGNTVNNSTSGSFTYQSSNYMTWGTPSWTVTGYNTTATIECTFTYVNVGIGGGNAAQAKFRYSLLNSNTWLWALYPSTGNVITSPGSGSITLSWQNVQNGDVFQLSQAGVTFPASVHTVANLATAPTQPQQPSSGGQQPSGGGPKRYPMILTQLFNKKRSFYSIGMTHKDGQLNCFL